MNVHRADACATGGSFILVVKPVVSLLTPEPAVSNSGFEFEGTDSEIREPFLERESEDIVSG